MTNKEQNQQATLKTNTNPSNHQQNSPEKEKSGPEKARLLKAEIKKEWSKLTDEDISLYESKPEVFFSRVKEKHNLNREQAQARLKEIKESCDSCNTQKTA